MKELVIKLLKVIEKVILLIGGLAIIFSIFKDVENSFKGSYIELAKSLCMIYSIGRLLKDNMKK